MDIYEKIFKTAELNMHVAGQKFSYSEGAFKSILYCNPHEVDIDEFARIDNSDFLFCAYLRLLNRLPDSTIKKDYQKRCTEQKDSIMLTQYYVLAAILKSEEFKNVNKKVIHFQEFRKMVKKTDKKNKMAILAYDFNATIVNKVIKILMHIWKLMPDKIKKYMMPLVRRIFS